MLPTSSVPPYTKTMTPKTAKRQTNCHFLEIRTKPIHRARPRSTVILRNSETSPWLFCSIVTTRPSLCILHNKTGIPQEYICVHEKMCTTSAVPCLPHSLKKRCEAVCWPSSVAKNGLCLRMDPDLTPPSLTDMASRVVKEM